MTMVGLPLILFGAEGKKDLSDLEYLSIKEFDGKRVDVDNAYSVSNTVTETDIATQTATGGKDMYLSKAFFSYNNFSSGTFTCIFRLRIDGTEVERFTKNISTTLESTELVFLTTAKKVGPSDIIKITVENSAAGATNGVVGTANLTLWEEPTGVSPEE